MQLQRYGYFELHTDNVDTLYLLQLTPLIFDSNVEQSCHYMNEMMHWCANWKIIDRRTIVPLSVSLWDDLIVTHCLMVWDWQVLRSEPMLSCWPNLLFIFLSYHFIFFFFSWVDCVGLGSTDWKSVHILSQPCTDDILIIIIKSLFSSRNK